MLHTLYALAEYERLAEDPTYRIQPLEFDIELKPNGALLQVRDLRQRGDSAKKSAKPRGRRMMVPRQKPGTRKTGSTIDPDFLYGNATFVLGMDFSHPPKYAAREDGAAELARRLAAFRELIADARAWIADTTHSADSDGGVEALDEGGRENAVRALDAILVFLDDADARAAAGREAQAQGDFTENQRFCFFFPAVAEWESLPVHLWPWVRRYWRTQFANLTTEIDDDGSPDDDDDDDETDDADDADAAESATDADAGGTSSPEVLAEPLQCLVTNQPVFRVINHPKVQLVGASGSGVPLVSFNRPAFESHAWKGNANAPISPDAAIKISAALTRLILADYPKPDGAVGEVLPKQFYRLTSDTTGIFWGDCRDPDTYLAPAVVCAALGDAEPTSLEKIGVKMPSVPTAMAKANVNKRSKKKAKEKASEQSAEKAQEVLNLPWVGKTVSFESDAPFFAMVLTGAQGRAIIRGFESLTLRDVRRNIDGWFADLALHASAKPLPLYALINAITPPGERGKQHISNLACDLFLTILRGENSRLSNRLLIAAINRCKAEQSSQYGPTPAARVALIRAWLRRYRRHALASKFTAPYPEIENPMPLDAPNNVGYLLGRLFNQMQYAQLLALGEQINATIVDKYFAAACSTPQAVFPKLLKLTTHHLRKAEQDSKNTAGVKYVRTSIRTLCTAILHNENHWPDERLSLDQIMRRAGGNIRGFPARLDMHQQGLFILGFYERTSTSTSTAESDTDESADATTTTDTTSE